MSDDKYPPRVEWDAHTERAWDLAHADDDDQNGEKCIRFGNEVNCFGKEADDDEDGNVVRSLERLVGSLSALGIQRTKDQMLAARQVVCLERIANALERAFPAPPDPDAPINASEGSPNE